MQRSSRRQLLALAAAVLTTTVLVRATAAAPGQVVQYQGRLVDSNGVPLEGPVGRLTFLIYGNEAATPAHFVRGEEHAGVPVNRGVFTVSLGRGAPVGPDGTAIPGGTPTPFTNEFDGGEERWIVTRVDGNQVGGPVRLGAVPYAVSAGGSVPIGTVVDWFRPDPALSVPVGWWICDGSVVTTQGSPFQGKRVPDLRGRFVRGLTSLDASYGATGGGAPPGTPEQGGAASHSFAHQHDVSVTIENLPDHTHSIAVDGAHAHSAFLGDQDGHTRGTSQSFHGGDSSFYVFSMFGPGPSCTHQFPVHVAGVDGHSHGGNTGGPTVTPNAQSTASGSTQSYPATIPTEPPFVGLLKIVRVQ